MAILLHPRKDSVFPKEEAIAVSNQETNFVGLKVFFSQISRLNFFAVKLIKRINGIPSSI